MATTDAVGSAIRPPDPGMADQLEALRALWAEVLDLDSDQIADTDNFFDIGGDSMLALEAAILCRRAGMDMPVSGLLRYPVLAELAEAVLDGRGFTGSNERP